jgi:hypothetical protein
VIVILNASGVDGVFVAIAITLAIGAVSSMVLGQETAGLSLEAIAPAEPH